MQAVAPMQAGEHIALDGKMLRRSLDRYAGQEAITVYLLTAILCPLTRLTIFAVLCTWNQTHHDEGKRRGGQRFH